MAEGFAVTGFTHLVLGVLDGRDPVELLEILDAEEAETVVCCSPRSPRALPASDLADIVRRAGGRPIVVDDVGDAIERVLSLAAPDDIVLVTGSLYTVGDARAACRRLGLVADR